MLVVTSDKGIPSWLSVVLVIGGLYVVGTIIENRATEGEDKPPAVTSPRTPITYSTTPLVEGYTIPTYPIIHYSVPTYPTSSYTVPRFSYYSIPTFNSGYYVPPSEDFYYDGETGDDYYYGDPYDLDCADVGYEVWVGDDDPDGLDADGDGWGCEGW